MEQIERDIKSREHDEKVYYTRFMFAFLGILVGYARGVRNVENAGRRESIITIRNVVVNLSLIPTRECWNTNYIRVKMNSGLLNVNWQPRNHYLLEKW